MVHHGRCAGHEEAANKLVDVDRWNRSRRWANDLLVTDETAHGKTTPAHAAHKAAREADMAFATEAHAVGDWDGSCAVGRGAQHADGFLTRLELVVAVGDAVHVQVVGGLGLAQLRCEI